MAWTRIDSTMTPYIERALTLLKEHAARHYPAVDNSNEEAYSVRKLALRLTKTFRNDGTFMFQLWMFSANPNPGPDDCTACVILDRSLKRIDDFNFELDRWAVTVGFLQGTTIDRLYTEIKTHLRSLGTATPPITRFCILHYSRDSDDPSNPIDQFLNLFLNDGTLLKSAEQIVPAHGKYLSYLRRQHPNLGDYHLKRIIWAF